MSYVKIPLIHRDCYLQGAAPQYEESLQLILPQASGASDLVCYLTPDSEVGKYGWPMSWTITTDPSTIEATIQILNTGIPSL